MNAYSHGVDSPIKLKISAKDAEAYNRIVSIFADNPDGDPKTLWATADPADVEVYNTISLKMDHELMAIGRAVGPDEITDVFLIKN